MTPVDPSTSTPSGPNETELALLKCFWSDGDLSSREVHARAGEQLGWTSSTTRTVLERMRAKGLIDRRSVHGVAVYAASQPKTQVIGMLVRRLSRLLDLDTPLPAAAFTGSQLLDADDIAALEALLAQPTEGGDEPR